MKHLIWDTAKVFLVFTLCTSLFYYGLKVMNREYEEQHRYDMPEGPAVKVFNSEYETNLIDRLNLFFRLGE